MTLRDRVNAARQKTGTDYKELDKLITYAYELGAHEATVALSDKVTEHLLAQTDRALSCRYWRMALGIVGTDEYIYSPYYSNDYVDAFGDDEIDL